jgi:hypothetical protein
VLAAVINNLGVYTGIDTMRNVDVAEDVVRPIMAAECALHWLALIMSRASVLIVPATCVSRCRTLWRVWR